MKKKTLLILAVLITALACLFTSCSASVEPPKADEEFGYVTFGNGGSRSLTTEYGIKSYDSLYWYYTATKKDNFGFTGQTNGQTVVPPKTGDGKGIGSDTIRLSQGAWEFELFAYESLNEEGNAGVNLVYQGKSDTIVLKGGETKAVPISVSLQGATGLVNLSQAWFEWKDMPNKDDGKIKVTISLMGDTDAEGDAKLNTLTLLPIISLDEDQSNKYTLGNFLSITQDGSTDIPAGYYTCTVRVYLGNDAVTGESTPVATQAFGLRVYGNATTYITGNIIESPDTKVEFTVPEQKMVAFNQNVASVALNPAGDDTKSTTINFVNNLEAGATHVLSVEVTDLATSTSRFVVDSSTKKTPVAGISLTLNSVKVNNGVTEQKEVKTFSEPIKITTYIAKGLTNVDVEYNGDGAQPTFVSYTPSSGELVFTTTHFSEYYAVADCYDALNETTNYAYATLESAVIEAQKDDKIVLYRDVTTESTISVDKGITIDLNGYSVYGDGVTTFKFLDGNSVITGSGTISSNVENVKSSVIQVGYGATTTTKLTIQKDVIISTDKAYGITVFGAKSEYLYVYGKVISNAPENDSYDGCAISTLGDDTTKSYIYIYDGAVVSAVNTNAIYMPSGELTVYDGSTITGRTGIYVKSGKTTIEGGTITGNGAALAYSYYGDGGISTGDAFVVDSCGYPRGTPSVSIKGGTFISKNAQPVASYKTGENNRVIGFIKGGKFNKEPEDILFFKPTYQAEENNGMWITHKHDWVNDSENRYKFAEATCDSAAKYYKVCSICDSSSNNSSYSYTLGVKLGHQIDYDQDDNTCERCGTTFPILNKPINTDGTYKTSGLSSFNGIQSGYYKLFKDIEHGRICIGSVLDGTMTVVIDLGGHKLTCKGSEDFTGIYFHPSSSKNTVTFTNGTIYENDSNLNPVLISIKGSTNNKMIFESDLNIVCVNPNTTAILVEKDGKLESSANITTKNGTAIQTNGSTTNADAAITITGGNITSDNVAIYLPSGTLKISGGTITGTTAVYTKGHKVTISGGTLVGKGEAAGYVYNGSGCNSTGNAFVVDSCNYPSGVPVVTISGGSFISEKNGAVGSYYGNGVETPVTGFITGGTFSSDPSAYVNSNGYKVTNNNDGTWTVTAK